MPFKADKPSIERFIDKNNTLYEALGLERDAEIDEIKNRVNLLRAVTTPAYIVEIANRAKEVETQLYQKKKRKAYDQILASAEKKLQRAALTGFLRTMVQNDGVLDAQEEQDYYNFGKAEGISRDELKEIFDDYVKTNHVKRVKAPRSAPAPKPTPAPRSTPQPAPQPTPPPSPAPGSGAPLGTMEERVRWGVVAGAGSAGVGGLACIALTHAARFPVSLIVVILSVIWGIRALHQRKIGSIIGATVLAFLATMGNPVLGGVVFGICTSVAVVLLVHWRGGSRGLAGTLASVVLVGSLGTGMVMGAGYLKPPAGRIVWPILAAESRRANAETEAAQTRGSRPTPVPVQGNDAHAPAKQQPAADVPVTMSFASSPSSAEVYVAGSKIGTTPCSKVVKPGTHAVLITKTGFQDYRKNVKITSRDGTDVNLTVDLQPLPVRAVEGTWKGEFDGKPIQLVVSQVNPDGSLQGYGTITLGSGSQTFTLKGSYDLTAKQMKFTAQESGMVFTGSVDSKATSMGGTSVLPGLDLSRAWSLTKSSSSVPKR